MIPPLRPSRAFRLRLRSGPPPDRTKQWQQFDQSFGKFVREFGQTESFLAQILEHFILRLIERTPPNAIPAHDEINIDITRALIGSRRTPDLANATKLCLKAAIYAKIGYTEQNAIDISKFFTHLSEIRFLRDRTAHFQISIDDVMTPFDCIILEKIWFKTVTRYTVNDIDKLDALVFQVSHLRAATEDLIVLRNNVSAILRQADYLPISWLYKPSDIIRRAAVSDPHF